MKNKIKSFKKNIKFRNWFISIIIAIVLIIIAAWPTDYYIESPGQALTVEQFFNPKYSKNKNLYLVTVSLTNRPVNLFQYLWSYTQKYDSRISGTELLAGQTNSQYDELQNWYMETSQQNAIYYAAKKSNLKPKLTYLGVYVMGIQKNSDFKNKLKIGDTVSAVNNHHFNSTKQMMSYLAKQNKSKKIKIEVLRNKIKRTFTGKIVTLNGTNRRGIGIQLVEHVMVTTKPQLTINAGEIGGPSAGLMFALESYQMLTKHNLTNNHKVAGTGTINSSGKIGIIGGVDKKVVAASRVGAEVFFAPTDSTGVKKTETNYQIAKRTARKINTKMKIVPVTTFDDALNYLKKNY